MALPFLFVQGKFSGNYYTDQGSTLVDGQAMPGPEKHHVKLYRGELHDIVPLQDFNPKEHLNRDALFLYNVTNIQLNPGNRQYIQDKIVHDFEQVVIKDAKVKDSWEIDGKTYGILEGTFMGKIKQATAAPNPEPNPPEPAPPVKPPFFPQADGCLSKIWDILKWLLLLLLLLLLLKKCNPSGCNFKLNNCSDCQEEVERLRKKIDSLNSDNTIGCSQAAKSGGRGITEKKHILGNKSGRVVIEYDMESVPDKMEVFYEGNLVTSTNEINGNVKGFVGGKNAAKCCGALSFDFQYNKDDHCMVRVTGGSTDTKWKYTLFCPQ